MNWQSVKDWLGEKTTIVGVSFLAGSVAAWALHVVDLRQAAIGALVGLVAAVLRESPSQAADALRQVVGEAQNVAILPTLGRYPGSGSVPAPGGGTMKPPPGG